MANKNVEALASLFHQESKFVHMSGSWKKAKELETIKSGSIWYKNTIVHDTDIEVVADTAIVWIIGTELLRCVTISSKCWR